MRANRAMASRANGAAPAVHSAAGSGRWNHNTSNASTGAARATRCHKCPRRWKAPPTSTTVPAASRRISGNRCPTNWVET